MLFWLELEHFGALRSLPLKEVRAVICSSSSIGLQYWHVLLGLWLRFFMFFLYDSLKQVKDILFDYGQNHSAAIAYLVPLDYKTALSFTSNGDCVQFLLKYQFILCCYINFVSQTSKWVKVMLFWLELEHFGALSSLPLKEVKAPICSSQPIRLRYWHLLLG